MTAGTLAVMAVGAGAVARAEAALTAQGAMDLFRRDVGAGRLLLYGRFVDEESTRGAVARLRRRGWAAAQRPADDDPHIIAWRNRTRPVSVGGGRLLVALPWAEFDRRSAPFVEVDPGGAFGGGAHPTTRLLLEELAGRLHGGERVLDVGCGSGVLALAAVRLGAASALGIDIDPAAVSATRANAKRNRLSTRVCASPTPLQEVRGSFDVVLANIGLEALLSLAADMERRLAPGGWIALSGISPAQVPRLAAAFTAIEVVSPPQLDDWAALVGVRRGSIGEPLTGTPTRGCSTRPSRSGP